MDEILKQSSTGVVSFLSSNLDGLAKEERRQKISDWLAGVDFNVDSSKREMLSTKDDIESARVKYENMNDLMKTMEQLKCSLEEHIKTVRLNEGSFGGTTAVLEYDLAKSRTNTLINVIKARAQLDNAKEALTEGGEDQQRVFDGLVDMQQSYDTLRQFVPNHGDDKALEEQKDRFLGWQAAALVFAIKQADYEKLSEIQRAYEKLGRKEDFLGTFKRVTINRLKEYTPLATHLSTLISGLRKEVEFVFTHHYQSACRFLPSENAAALISQALEDGLDQLNMKEVIAELLTDVTEPILTLQKLEQDLSGDITGFGPNLVHTMEHINAVVRNSAATPLRSALTSYALSRVNVAELGSGSFRSRLENFRSAVAEVLQLLYDLYTHTHNLYGTDVKDVAMEAIEKTIENFVAKLKNWNYSVSSTGALRSFDELTELCRSSGRLIFGINEFKALLESNDAGLSLSLKGINRWNKGVVEATLSSLRTTCSDAVSKVIKRMEETKNAGDNKQVARIGLMYSASEQMLTCGQEIFESFHKLEQCLDDDDTAHSFICSFKKKLDREVLFKVLAADLADRIIQEFIAGIPQDLNSSASMQVLKDLEFLKNAFEDLRIGDTAVISEVMEKLKLKAESS